MRNLLTKNFAWFVLSISAILVSAEPGWAVFIDLTEKGLGLKKGNYGTCLAVNEVIEISAITRIGNRKGQEIGTVYLNKGKKGLGVQRLDGRGGREISGGGRDQDEAVVFDFIRNVHASSIKVGLADYERKEDNPIVTLTLSGGDELVLTKSDINWNDAITFVRKKEVVVDLAVLVGHDFSGMATRLTVTETEEQLYVNSIAYETPEPATITLLVMGGLILRIRRK